MRAVLQRVSRARVVIDGETVGEIGRGLLVLLGVTHTDTPEQARWLAEKVEFYGAGKLNQREEYSEVKTNVPLDPKIFSPSPARE